MRENRIERTTDVSFGRPRIAGTGIPTFVLVDRFRGGDSMSAIAKDYGLARGEVEDAIRFTMLYPKADTEAFWNDRHTVGYADELSKLMKEE